MMHRWTILLLCALSVEAAAQTASVRGFVTDASSGEVLQGAHVTLTDEAGRLLGAASDRDGFFAVVNVPSGRYVLQASFIGYRAHEDTLQLVPGEALVYSIALEPSGAEALDEVLVEAERRSGAAGLRAGLQTIAPEDLERLPALDVSGDLAMYLSSLPGVVTPGDQGGQFFIRGGEPTQNLVLLDGVLIYQPFHVLGFYSAFPSDIVSHVDVYAGGFGPRFGGRLSSVIDVSTRNGNNQHFQGDLSLSPFTAGVRLEGPLRIGAPPVSPSAKPPFSFLVSGRHSVIEQGAAHLIERPVPFLFNDLFAKVHGYVGPSGRLSLTAVRTYDRGTVGEDVGGKPPESIRWNNEGIGARYLFLPGRLPVLAEFLVSASRLESEFEDHTERFASRSSTTARYGLEANVTYYSPLVDVQWGLFARTLVLDSELGGLYQNVVVDREFLTEVGAYLAPAFHLDNGLTLSPGLRLHAFPSKNETFVEPRLRAVWERGPHQISGAAGLYHQEVVGLTDRRDANSIFTAWTAVPLGEVPRAVHALLGYQRRLGPGLNAVVEGYYKRLSNLFIAEWTAFPRFTTRLQQARGRVVGIDMRVELQRAWFYGYLNYGLSSVEYEAMQPSLELWFDAETLRFRPGHDRRHQVNALVSTSLYGFDLSARWQFGSGLPFNRALGFDGFILMDEGVDVFEEEGSRRVIFERPFQGILPAYHRLDVSAERTFETGAALVTLQASVLNLYDRANIFYLDVFTLRRVDQLPLLPSLGLKVAFE